MTAQDKDRIECAIRHIESSLDVDPWAVEIAVEAMEKQMPVKASFDPDMDYVECPVCCQLTNANGFPEDIKYCYHCGKAFDWEGEA